MCPWYLVEIVRLHLSIPFTVLYSTINCNTVFWLHCMNEWLVFSVQWRLGRFASTGGRICATTAESRWGTTDKTGAVLSATTARQPGLRCKRKNQICWHTQNNIPSRTCISTLSSCSSGTLLVFGNFFTFSALTLLVRWQEGQSLTETVPVSAKYSVVMMYACVN